MLKPITLEALLDLAEQQARLVLTVLHKDLMPSWVIIKEDGTPIIRGTPWRNEAEKYAAEIFIQLELKKHRARAFSFVSEAWVAMAPKDWDPSKPMPKADRPMNRADRREEVIAFATDGQDRQSRRWSIMRNWKGDVEHLERLPADDWSPVEGWITDMLKS